MASVHIAFSRSGKNWPVVECRPKNIAANSRLLLLQADQCQMDSGVCVCVCLFVSQFEGTMKNGIVQSRI